jgi:hypothetical protein
LQREFFMRTGGKRFERIGDVISEQELRGIGERYRSVAGFEIDALRKRASFV